jgi:RES domain
MILFRQVDARFPFLWEDAKQPSARWHREGDGPAHYFADTPDGAWAEFLRHEEITEVDDLLTIRRQLWAVEVGDAPATRVSLPADVLTGGPDTYEQRRREAERLRRRGVTRLVAPSAAMRAGAASGRRVRNGVVSASPRDASVTIIFGAPDDLVGWIAADDARPSADLLPRVHHYGSG